MAKLSGEIKPDDFDVAKKAITEEIARIETEIKALDSERNTMKDLLKQAQAQSVDLVGAWKKGNLNQRQELARAFFPDGLFFSHELRFFEPSNLVIQQMVWRFLEELSKVGVPNPLRLNPDLGHLHRVLARLNAKDGFTGTQGERTQ